MLFHDYITLLLANMTAGLWVLAAFLLFRGAGECRKAWAAALGMPGAVAFVVGLGMVFTWPIPRLEKMNLMWANCAYGEMSVLLGVLFLGAAWAVAKGWKLWPLGIYSAVAGAAAIVVGAAIWKLWLSAAPLLTAVGFFLSGASGVLIGPALTERRWRWPFAVVVALLLVAAGVIWAVTAGLGYWAHMERFSR